MEKVKVGLIVAKKKNQRKQSADALTNPVKQSSKFIEKQ